MTTRKNDFIKCQNLFPVGERVEKNKAEWWQGGLEPLPLTKSFGKATDRQGGEVWGQARRGCSALQETPGKEAGGLNAPQAVARPVLAGTLSLGVGGAEETSLGFVPRAQSQFGGTGPSLFLAQQVAWGGGQEALLLPPKQRDPHGKKPLGQVGPQGGLWPGLWLGELDCTSLAPGMGLGWAGGSNSWLSRALCFWQNEAFENVIGVPFWGTKGQLEGSHRQPGQLAALWRPGWQHRPPTARAAPRWAGTTRTGAAHFGLRDRLSL